MTARISTAAENQLREILGEDVWACESGKWCSALAALPVPAQPGNAATQVSHGGLDVPLTVTYGLRGSITGVATRGEGIAVPRAHTEPDLSDIGDSLALTKHAMERVCERVPWFAALPDVQRSRRTLLHCIHKGHWVGAAMGQDRNRQFTLAIHGTVTPVDLVAVICPSRVEWGAAKVVKTILTPEQYEANQQMIFGRCRNHRA